MAECWYESHSLQLKDDILQIRKTVPENILREVLNKPQKDSSYTSSSDEEFYISHCFSESAPMNSLVWFEGFKGLIDWASESMGPAEKSINWIGAAIKADMPISVIEGIEKIALADGWSWSQISTKAWQQLFFLNVVSDCREGHRQDWLLNRAEQFVPEALHYEWTNKSNESYAGKPFFLERFSPLTSSIYWLSTGSSDDGCSGLLYWQKNFHKYPEEQVDWCLSALRYTLSSPEEKLLNIKTKDVILGFISEIEREKLTEKVGASLISAPIQAL